MSEDIFELVTVKEYAEQRGVSVRTVRRWIVLRWIDAERTAGEHGQWRIKVPRAKAS
jgi:excisionase family DNA binding protein